MKEGEATLKAFNLFSVITEKKFLAVGILTLLILISALSIVYVRDLNRRLFISLESAKVTQDHLQTRWGKLLLEESAWSTQARIQRIAQQKLAMQVPKPKAIIMVIQETPQNT